VSRRDNKFKNKNQAGRSIEPLSNILYLQYIGYIIYQLDDCNGMVNIQLINRIQSMRTKSGHKKVISTNNILDLLKLRFELFHVVIKTFHHYILCLS
jgi:hypothetical protein